MLSRNLLVLLVLLKAVICPPKITCPQISTTSNGKYTCEGPKNPIGSGASAATFKVKETKTGSLFALKVVDFKEGQESGDKVQKEIDILKLVKHPNIINLIDAFVDQTGKAFMVLELAEGGTLGDFVRKSPDFYKDIPKVVNTFVQIAEAIHALHRKRIVHTDIKLSNILLDSQNRPKVIDFDLAQVFWDKGHYQGTPNYMAPELYREAETAWTPEQDTFSLGVVFYAMLHQGSYPFNQDEEEKGMQKMEESYAKEVLGQAEKAISPGDFSKLKKQSHKQILEWAAHCLKSKEVRAVANRYEEKKKKYLSKSSSFKVREGLTDHIAWVLFQLLRTKSGKRISLKYLIPLLKRIGKDEPGTPIKEVVIDASGSKKSVVLTPIGNPQKPQAGVSGKGTDEENASILEMLTTDLPNWAEVFSEDEEEEIEDTNQTQTSTQKTAAKKQQRVLLSGADPKNNDPVHGLGGWAALFLAGLVILTAIVRTVWHERPSTGKSREIPSLVLGDLNSN